MKENTRNKNHFIRIFVTYMLIILITSILIGYFSTEMFKYILLIDAKNKMVSNINLIKSNVESDNTNINFQELSKKYSEDIKANVVFLNSSGTILGEPVAGINKNKDFKNSTEIIDANNSTYGYTLIDDKSSDGNVFSMASKVKMNGFNGYIYVSEPLRSVKEMNRNLIIFSFFGVIFVLISSFILKKLFERDILRPIEYITLNSQSTGKDNIKDRVLVDSNDVIGIMSEEYNSMLDRIESTINDLEESKKSIESGFQNISIGVIQVDTELRIVFVNPFMLSLFKSKFNELEIRDKKLIELIRDSKIIKSIKQCIDEKISDEFETGIGEDEEQTVRVCIEPIISDREDANVLGSFITIYDVTKIRKLEQMGYDYISNATHELKTPLTSIKGFVETLKDGAIDDKEVSHKFLGIIEQECERLSNLISDILQLSEIQNTEEETNTEPCHMQDIVAEVGVFLKKQAQARDIKLIKNIDENIPVVMLNKNRIKQMIINIVDNAIKYTHAGGKVEMKCYAKDNQVVLSVKDDGIGIPKEALSRLFERFYRVDKGRSRSQGGTGLGLSIVKNIVDLYNGTIEVFSEVGKGTEFVIKLPIKR